MEWIKLLGIVVIVVGFYLKFDTIATVLLAGIVTALVSGISAEQFLDTLGTAFVGQRFVSFFFLTLPMIGLAENFGLKQRAVQLIQGMRKLTLSSLLSTYLIVRVISGLFALRVGGHTQFVRPLIQPMAEATVEEEALTPEARDTIKGLSAANDNFGNFFGQNTFVGASGVLLISGTLTELGYTVNVADIAAASLPIAVSMVVIGIGYNYYMARKITGNRQKGGES